MVNVLVPVFLAALAIFVVVLVAMAIGVLMGRKAIQGSCGGLANQRDADGQTSCSACSQPSPQCRSRLAAEAQSEGVAAEATEPEESLT
jgi:hypothetical protein